MKITKYKMGLQIEPDTSEEEELLNFLLIHANLKYLPDALRKAYCVSVESSIDIGAHDG